jgi:hypothetical protein
VNTFPRYGIENIHRGLGGKLFFSGGYLNSSNTGRFVLGEIGSTLTITSAKSDSFYGADASIYEQVNGSVMVVLSARIPPFSSNMFGPASMLLSSSLVPVNIKITNLFASNIYIEDNIKLSETKFLQCLAITDYFINSPFQTNYSQVRKYSSLFTECNMVSNYAIYDSVLTWPALSTLSVQIDSLVPVVTQGVSLIVPPFNSTGTSCTPTGLESVLNAGSITISPNPTNSVLTFSIPDGFSVLAIEIFDVSGSRKSSLNFGLNSQNQISVDTDKLPSGVYFISILAVGSNQPIKKKFVKLN